MTGANTSIFLKLSALMRFSSIRAPILLFLMTGSAGPVINTPLLQIGESNAFRSLLDMIEVCKGWYFAVSAWSRAGGGAMAAVAVSA